MKLSQLSSADTARRELKHLRALQDKTNRSVRYDGFLSVGGENSLPMTHAEVDAVLDRREAELMATFEALGIEVDE